MLQSIEMPTYRHSVWSLPASRSQGVFPGGLRVAQMGRQKSLPGFDNRADARGRLIPHVVQSGEGVFETRYGSWKASKGDLFIFFPDVPVRYRQVSPSPWRYTWLVLEGPEAMAALGRSGFTPPKPFRGGEHDALLEPLFNEIEAAYGREQFSDLFPCAAAWRVAEALCPRSGPADAPTGSSGLAETAKFWFDHGFMERIEIDETARRLGVTRSTLFRRFHERYGVSPKQYLATLRLDQAKGLLLRTETSVKEIAAVCGFQGAHYFCRVFREHTRTTPLAWRMAERRKK